MSARSPALLLLLALGCDGLEPPPPQVAAPPAVAPTTAPADHPEATLRAQLVAQPLALTRHGACRMDCRRVTEEEVRGVLTRGAWQPDRTRTDGPCPSHAFEGTGTDGHALRVVFAACADETRVVTAIDLDQDWPCACD